MGEIKIIDHLSPAKAETRAELGNNLQSDRSVTNSDYVSLPKGKSVPFIGQ